MIPYSRQKISKSDVNAVNKILYSDYLTTGATIPEFEKKLKKYCNSKYCTVVNSATSALHIACLALNLKKNDWLWTSPISFVASANCGIYCGAKVDFIDIDPITRNI